jgi:dipeptidyl aminopeptidase/acylaminoacyl peptidase
LSCTWGEICDPYLELQDGVLPAIQKIIDLGIADSDRIGVMGASYGGYSTYGLISSTDRFKVAISLAGISDLTSLYGSFVPDRSYTPALGDNVAQVMYSFELGQFRMGSPPWTDPGRFYRNSPISYVERVHTPVMIIQGDMDPLTLGQGEEFFAALYRQNKRAAWVRYWGENHGIESPANILDMWNRMFAWLDEFLMPAGAANAPNSQSQVAKP